MTKHHGDHHNTYTEVKTYDDHTVKAAGDGSVASGGAISGSTIISGNDNQFGNGNIDGHGNVTGTGNAVVNGDGNVAGFGAGAVNSFQADDVTVGKGGAIANGGSVSVDNSDRSIHDSNNSYTSTKVEDSGNTTTDNSQENSNNTETESHTETHTDIEGSYNDFAKWVESNVSKVEDSHNEHHHYDV